MKTHSIVLIKTEDGDAENGWLEGGIYNLEGGTGWSLHIWETYLHIWKT